MIKKIYKFIITSLSVFILSCPIMLTASAWWKFWDMVGVKWVGVYGTEKQQEDSLIHTIRKAINWVLGLLSFICLCLVIYAGFLMLTSGWDSKKYETWFSIIKNAALWLAIIAVSWLLVSLIFYVINTAVETK
jgi:hypothetical protein